MVGKALRDQRHNQTISIDEIFIFQKTQLNYNLGDLSIREKYGLNLCFTISSVTVPFLVDQIENSEEKDTTRNVSSQRVFECVWSNPRGAVAPYCSWDLFNSSSQSNPYGKLQMQFLKHMDNVSKKPDSLVDQKEK